MISKERRGRVAVVIVAVLVGAILVSTVGASTGADGWPATTDRWAAGDSSGSLLGGQETQESPDAVQLEIALHDNGSASMVVQHRYRLDTDEAIDAWEDRRRAVETTPEEYVERYSSRLAERIVVAENATGRDMEITGMGVEARNSSLGEYGVVEYNYTWRSFSFVEVNRIEAGDALAASELVLDERTTMIVTWPESYNLSSVEPEPDDRRDRTVMWFGSQTEFLDGEPRIVLLETGSGDPVRRPDDSGSLLEQATTIVVITLALVVVAGGGWLVHRRRLAGGGGRAIQGALEAPTEEGPPPELLSNEERVLRLLEERGGRIKQQEVVAELDWTEAKTSHVVSDLRANDEIEVFRIGRENVLTLPEEETAGRAGADEAGS